MVSLTQIRHVGIAKIQVTYIGNCLRLQAREEFLANQNKTGEGVKLKAPASQGPGCRGGAKIDPPLSMLCKDKFESMLKDFLSSNSVSNDTKQCVLKRAVLQCPSITMEFFGLKVPSLLDLGSMVMLIHKNYFNKHILPLLHGTAEELTKAHSLFWLSATNNQVMPVSKYFEADISLLGFTIPSVGFFGG